MSSADGSFGVVVRPSVGTTKERSLVDEGRLTEEMREALEADTFIIYGKSSVEQYDDDHPPQKIEMEAFEQELDSFLDSGIISRRHKDIPLGEPVASYTLDEPAEVVVADEVLEFDAGDTLETGVEGDELWIVADLRNDSEIARETRLGAMTGDLTGFSVTVFCKEWDETSKGQRVTEIDWHSTTIGGDEHIKNEDSRFGVAEFKAAFDSGFPGLTGRQAERAATEVLRELPTDMSAETQQTDEKGFWDRVRDIASQKAEEADPDGGPEAGKADEEQTEESKGAGDGQETPEEEKGGDEEPDAKAGDADAVLEQVKNELGEQQAEVLKEEMSAGPPAREEAPEDEDDEDEPEDEMANSEAEEGELKAGDVEEAMKAAGFVTEQTLEEKLEEETADAVTSGEFGDRVGNKLDERLPDGEVASKNDVEEVMEAAEEVLTETLPEAQKAAAEDAADKTAEKMVTGETPDPSGGSAQDQRDYKAQIQSEFGSTGEGN
jgi:hypothetical protein